MAFPISRATAFRGFTTSEHGESNSHSTRSASTRARRPSTHSSYKGKEPARDDPNGDHVSPTSPIFGSIELSPSRHKPAARATRSPSAEPAPAANTKKASRSSIIAAASDALGFRFGRRRPSIRQPPMPIILPDVIEISAPRRDRDAEDEELDRLRDMAAQSIGLPAMMKPDVYSVQESPVEEQQEPVPQPQTPAPTPEPHHEVPQSPHESSYSIAVPTSPVAAHRHRSRSLLAHSRTNSITLSLTPLPPFPATFHAINPFQQSGTMLYKYYQPSSLRIFALSRNWRHRFMVLSSPTAPAITRGAAVSYLHLFKSSAGEEKEMERLEINEDSVVFIAEEEVAGRKHVVKVGGVDVGAMKKELNHEESGRTMWFLHIADQKEAQKWINVIKTAILGQRTVRAGLGLPGNTFGGIEPRGDMDVMLSMRAQGLISSAATSTSITPASTTTPRSPSRIATSSASPQQAHSERDRNYASSISSHRSQATVARSMSTGAVSALKGLFTGSTSSTNTNSSSGTRPRSTSRAMSIDSQPLPDRDPHEDSFGSMGSHLLGGSNHLRAGAGNGLASELAPSVATHASLPYAGTISILAPESRLERKITSDRPIQWATSTTSVESAPPAPAPGMMSRQERANKAMSLGSLSLQPPPRKRWTSTGPVRPGPDSVVHAYSTQVQAIDEGVVAALAAGVSGRAETEPPSSPTMSGFNFGTPEQRPTRTESFQSVSTLASASAEGANSVSASLERSSSSTRRSSVKRWSRQGVLPKRSSPPVGSLPSVPTSAASSSASVSPSTSRSARHSVDVQPTRSRTSSSHSASSQKSFVSSLPSFSKRTSGSSVYSYTSTLSRPASSHSHRFSIPPPRPAPTSALPPAPDQDPNSDPFYASSSKPSFRDSVTNRAFRLSMSAPKPPPSSVLPPRPDEVDQLQHDIKAARRNSSSSAYSQTSSISFIPASLLPAPPVTVLPPFPPPRGPLPPTPASALPLPNDNSTPKPTPPRPPSRHISIKQRLRILSAPSPAATPPPMQLQPPPDILTNAPPLRRPLPSPLAPFSGDSAASHPLSPILSPSALASTVSPPATPIAEKITMYQNDPSFLQIDTPVTPFLPPPRALPIPPAVVEQPQVTSLSPPPRRASKHVAVAVVDAESPVHEDKPEGAEQPHRLMSLSRPGSVISLGIVSV
ncbi:hypothetical protein H0H81_004827 [Sphagnurus paluster]|uniref:PH domain-containing protein n=1 Tax=Sphagnurus paluster TaxID=117069 RepID=A0A9P7FYY1_9AGAR|nr:hypothetical protein H0H81_004827 [Sphagnurus paluster]